MSKYLLCQHLNTAFFTVNMFICYLIKILNIFFLGKAIANNFALVKILCLILLYATYIILVREFSDILQSMIMYLAFNSIKLQLLYHISMLKNISCSDEKNNKQTPFHEKTFYIYLYLYTLVLIQTFLKKKMFSHFLYTKKN